MSLSGALQIGRSGLLANQAAIEVTGHNLSNVATRGYHRQSIGLAPVKDQAVGQGIFIGRGVQVQQILRQVDEALEGRVRGGVADQAGSAARQDVLSQVEALHNELSDIDLSTQLSQFFNAWSELANSPLDNSIRTVVMQQGDSLASFVRNLRAGLSELRARVDNDINASARAADDLLTRIADLDHQIARAEAGSPGAAHGLRDQRTALLGELSQYVDVSTVEQPTGSVDVYVGSTPLVLDGKSRGLEVRQQTVNGELKIDLVLKDDGSAVTPRSGKLGALIAGRENDVNHAMGVLDSFANQLIYQVNRIHSQGQGTTGLSSVTGTTKVADASAALNDPAAVIPFAVGHGSFQVHVTQKSTGQRTSGTINIDLDGLNGNDTTLAGLAASLDAVANLDASITPDGRLKISAAGNDFEVSFSEDSSGVLAALGINTFFAGGDARDIAVNALVAGSPARLAAAQTHEIGDNRNALALAGLRNQRLDALGGLSLSESWNRHVEDYAVRLGQANAQVEADTVVRGSLEAQQQSVSGVNTDEEAINLLSYQRAYQGSARFLSVVDQMMQTLLELV